ncbi:hypothetical protein SORBI_3009G078401 [Sorghum bicolor]|jgi:hypothetical protein|uniref:Uncharacterized protein n=1 Tax=Sorghum bicolor TaxID=4558 RepID=A0A1Z5R2F1_SORBI|nr:hypothetical protein SORBI_3009G078401 [Sorghum bicolor]
MGWAGLGSRHLDVDWVRLKMYHLLLWGGLVMGWIFTRYQGEVYLQLCVKTIKKLSLPKSSLSFGVPSPFSLKPSKN